MIDDEREARLTPFEMGIPGADFAVKAFRAIRAEAEERGADTTDPGGFLQLGEVGRLIREFQGDGRGAEGLQRIGSFLFHAFHFHEAGRPLLLLERTAARWVTAPDFASSWEGELPAPAGYLQLPRNLFWTEGDGEIPEAIDGAFWTEAHRGTLSLLLATGMRAGRPGFSLVEIPPTELSILGQLSAEQIRKDGPDFETTLPGGELDELYSITTLGEALKLVGRVFALLDEAPESLGAEESASDHETRADEASGSHPSLPSSSLPFRRIRARGGVRGE